MNTKDILSDLKRSVTTGKIFSLPRGRLEQFVTALAHPKAQDEFSVPEFPRLCETARMALAYKISEDANLQAKRESRLALIIAVLALFSGIVQAFVVLWQFFVPAPIQVYAPTTNPVYVAPIALKPQTHATPTPAQQPPKPSAK